MFESFSYSDIGIILLSIIISIGIHEAMHTLVAYKLGDDTAVENGRLTLNPLKHIDVFTTILLPLTLLLLRLPPIFIAKPVPLDPYRIKYEEYGVALVALAGPFTNLALAFMASAVMKFTTIDNSAEVLNALNLFIQVNVGFFVFNMIPIPPLDGSRLLYAFAPDGLRKIMESVERAGFVAVLSVLMLIVFLFGTTIAAINFEVYKFILSW